MINFSSLIRALIHHLGNLPLQGKISFLRLAGVQIGKNCMICLRAQFDVRRGSIIFGDNCTIIYGCLIFYHDRSAMHNSPSDSLEGTVVIANNVCIGVGAINLRKVTIDDNSVICAGAVVRRDIPSVIVASVNPVLIIKNVDRYRTGSQRLPIITVGG